MSRRLARSCRNTRKGPLGDPYKIYCTTCHQGAYKPLYGAPMLKDYPSLAQPLTAAGAEAVEAPTADAPAVEVQAMAAPAEEAPAC
jgi:photosynthetic reaction center cytochrome c subunit